MKRVRFLRPSFFIWLVLPLSLYGFYLAQGLPHLIWSYEWREAAHGYASTARRHYTRCTYLGPYGAFTEDFPPEGRCGWVQFHKEPGGS